MEDKIVCSVDFKNGFSPLLYTLTCWNFRQSLVACSVLLELVHHWTLALTAVFLARKEFQGNYRAVKFPVQEENALVFLFLSPGLVSMLGVKKSVILWEVAALFLIFFLMYFIFTETGNYTCEFCGKQYKYYTPYQEHVALHAPISEYPAGNLSLQTMI